MKNFYLLYGDDKAILNKEIGNIKKNLNEDKKETEKEDEYIKKQKNKFSKY